jgi:Na+-translocating ferredoxin:NAD+ oxidoreductase RnfC subunit
MTKVLDKEQLVSLVKAAGLSAQAGGISHHVKMAASAEVVIANAAEGEPLTHVDKALLMAESPLIVAGMKAVMAATGAPRGVIGIKGKYTAAIAAMRQAIGSDASITIFELGNFYPAGDEHVLVFDVLGKVVPEGGLPIAVGAVVQNIETLYNIGRAIDGVPVTEKFITVIGDVPHPVTVKVPIGVTLREVLALAGRARPPKPTVIKGGAMMGRVVDDLDAPVTKTTKMLLVLPFEHELSVKRRQTRGVIFKHAIAACDQCYMCTDYCPRHAQGHEIQPHKLILLLASGVAVTDAQLSGALLCCECRTCNYACPVHLAPGDIALTIKRDLVKARVKNPYNRQTEPDPYRDFRRVPMNRLISRLDLAKYDQPAHLTPVTVTFNRVTLSMRQHIGAPCQPIVQVGERVSVGQVVGQVPENALGVPVHASIAGVVKQVSADAVVIEAN